MTAEHLLGQCASYNSELHILDHSLFDLCTLETDIAVALPYTDDAHTALRHIHTVNMNGHKIILAVPARIFDSDLFVPYIKRHTQSIVHEARNMLKFYCGASSARASEISLADPCLKPTH